jgi:hypothetical protein
MKETIFTLVALLSACAGIAQKTKKKATVNYDIPLTNEKWQIPEGKAEFLQRNGHTVIQLKEGNQGAVYLKDITFSSGTIEFEFEPSAPMSLNSAPTVYFRSQPDRRNTEIFYLRARPNRTTANDAVQYAPVIDGVNLWDLYPEYQAPAYFETGKTNHLKMIISGEQLRVYVNDLTAPALEVLKLEGKFKDGGIGLDGGVTISNFKLKPGVIEDLPANAAPDLTRHDANYLRTWHVTLPTDLPVGHDVIIGNLPKADSFRATITAERKGLVNLTREFGGNASRKVIWLKTKIRSTEAQRNVLQLGFSDEVWVYLNGQLAFLDKNYYLQPLMRKYPEGRISIQNARFPLPLKQGDNELVIAVANDFYGWGIIARLENMEGVGIEK